MEKVILKSVPDRTREPFIIKSKGINIRVWFTDREETAMKIIIMEQRLEGRKDCFYTKVPVKKARVEEPDFRFAIRQAVMKSPRYHSVRFPNVDSKEFFYKCVFEYDFLNNMDKFPIDVVKIYGEDGMPVEYDLIVYEDNIEFEI